MANSSNNKIKTENDLITENKKLKRTLLLIEKAIKNKCGYAEDLVWYARSKKDQKAGKEHRIYVENKYPKQVKELIDDNSNWVHGFNSGCLAVSRLVLSLAHSETEFEESKLDEEKFPDDVSEPSTFKDHVKSILDDFPWLDT